MSELEGNPCQVTLTVASLVSIINHSICLDSKGTPQGRRLGILLGPTHSDQDFRINAICPFPSDSLGRIHHNPDYARKILISSSSNGDGRVLGLYASGPEESLSDCSGHEILEHISSVTERPASRFLFLRFSHGRPPTVSIFTRTPEISSDSHYTVCAAIIQAGEIPSSHRDLHSSCESLGRLIYKACRRFLLDPSLSGSFVPYVLAPLSRIGLPPLGSCDIHLPSGCYNNREWIQHYVNILLENKPPSILPSLPSLENFPLPNWEITSIEGSDPSDPNDSGRWETNLRVGITYFEFRFWVKPDSSEDTFEKKSTWLNQLLLREMPEWVVQMMRYSGRDGHPTTVELRSDDNGVQKFTFLAERIPEIEQWHPVVMDELALVNRKRFVRQWLWTCEIDGTKAVAKTFSWPEMQQYIASESEAYRRLSNCNFLPKFLGHLQRNGRVIGIILDWVEGHHPTEEDIPACLNVLAEYNRQGMRHGDVHPRNFIISPRGAILLDIQAVPWDENNPEELSRLLELDYSACGVQTRD